MVTASGFASSMQEEVEVGAQLQGELGDIEAQIKALDAQLGSQSPGMNDKVSDRCKSHAINIHPPPPSPADKHVSSVQARKVGIRSGARQRGHRERILKMRHLVMSWSLKKKRLQERQSQRNDA